jgi:uncharacterized surface protein with fasciclin (FAS1) repeats
MNKRQWFGLALLTGLLAACATAPAPRNVADTLAATPSLSTFSQLVDDAGLRPSLAAAGPVTVFAPSNEAFKAVPPKTLESIAKDKDRLAALLNFHVAPGKLVSGEVKNGPVKTVQGANLALAKSGNTVTVEDAVVTTADLPATNGTVQVIDRVLTPPAK